MARKHAERLAETARINRFRGIEKQFTEKRRALASDFTRQRQILRAKVRDFNLQATKEGKEMAAELEHVRAFSELNAITGALPPSVRERIGGNVTLAQLRGKGQSITNFMVSRIERIDKELEKHFQEVYQERIRALLKSKLPKRSSAGLKKSVIGADAQEVVDRVAGYAKMSMEQLHERAWAIEAELMAATDPIQQSRLVMEQMELDTFGAIDQMTASQLAAAYESLRETIATGKAAWGKTEEARLQDIADKALEIKTTSPPASEAGAAETSRHKLRNFIGNYARNHGFSYPDFGVDVPKATLIKRIGKLRHQAGPCGYDLSAQRQTRLVETLKKMYSARAWLGRWATRWRRWISRISQCPPPEAWPPSARLFNTCSAWNQPKVQENMRAQGWTDEHVEIYRYRLPPITRQLRRWLSLFSRATRRSIRWPIPVYVRLYGMHLPRIKGVYAPMRYHVGGTVSEMTMTGGMPSSGVTPTALKARVDHKAKLRHNRTRFRFSRSTLPQMSHWIHMAEFVREKQRRAGRCQRQTLD